MKRILATITTLDQHEEALRMDRGVYRPDACPHCGLAGLWHHGCYCRKADRSAGVESRNPVVVLRFLCSPCQRTCSRLPLCVAPLRWYDWAVQQIALLLLLSGSVGRHAPDTAAWGGTRWVGGGTGSRFTARRSSSGFAADSRSWVGWPTTPCSGATSSTPYRLRGRWPGWTRR